MWTATTSLILLGAGLFVGTPHPPIRLTNSCQAQEWGLASLYKAAVDFRSFLRSARKNRLVWYRNYHNGEPNAKLIARAKAIHGRWRILVITDDWCSDSLYTIPSLARLVDEVPGLDMRIVDSSRGRHQMERHLTLDFRPATPTVVVLDESFGEVGCWIERPRELRDLLLEARGSNSGELQAKKSAWYADDRGESAVAEIVSVIEAAAAGSRICEAA